MSCHRGCHLISLEFATRHDRAIREAWSQFWLEMDISRAIPVQLIVGVDAPEFGTVEVSPPTLPWPPSIEVPT